MCTVTYAVTIETIQFLNKNVNINFKTGNIVRTAVINEKNIYKSTACVQSDLKIQQHSGIICSKT